MVKNWLRAFFLILVLVGGIWWYRGWKQKQGDISPVGTQIEVESSPSPQPSPSSGSEVVAEEHQPVNAGVSDWELWQVIGLIGLIAVGATGLYKVTYRVYWLD